MKGLSQAVEYPMDFAEKEIVMSDITLCSLNEHLGRTLADIPLLFENDDYNIFSGPMFSNFTVFSKYIFEYIYAIWNMNAKLYFIHGDLHLNNVTMFRHRDLYYLPTQKYFIENPHIVYNLFDPAKGESNLLIFPHYGRFSCIIDFSRAIVGRPQLKKDFTEFRVDEIISNQRKRIFRIFKRELPDFVNENKEKIEVALIDNFDTMFKLFTAVDSFKLISGIIHLVELKVLDNPKIADKVAPQVMKNEVLPWLGQIRDTAFKFLTSVMHSVFERKIIKPEEIEWPNLTILKKFFTHAAMEKFSPDEGKTINLVDYFSSENTLQYNIREYENFPPNIKFEHLIKMKWLKPGGELLSYQNYTKHSKYLKTQPVKKVHEIGKETRHDKKIRRGTELIHSEKSENLKSKTPELDISSPLYYAT